MEERAPLSQVVKATLQQNTLRWQSFEQDFRNIDCDINHITCCFQEDESGEHRLGAVACVRSRQVSLHTRQVSPHTRRVILFVVREFGMRPARQQPLA